MFQFSHISRAMNIEWVYSRASGRYGIGSYDSPLKISGENSWQQWDVLLLSLSGGSVIVTTLSRSKRSSLNFPFFTRGSKGWFIGRITPNHFNILDALPFEVCSEEFKTSLQRNIEIAHYQQWESLIDSRGVFFSRKCSVKAPRTMTNNSSLLRSPQGGHNRPE